MNNSAFLLIADALADLCSAFRQLADPENYVLTSEQPPTKPKPKPKGTTHDLRPPDRPIDPDHRGQRD